MHGFLFTSSEKKLPSPGKELTGVERHMKTNFEVENWKWRGGAGALCAESVVKG